MPTEPETGHVAESGRTRRRGAVLEDAILAAAFSELCEVGYDGLSMERVAGRAGAGKGSIYRRWSTKQQLVIDALSAGLPVASFSRPHPAAGRTTAEELRSLALSMVRVLDGSAGDAMRAVICESAHDLALAQAIERRFQEPLREAILGILRRGVEHGEVAPTAVCRQVADMVPAYLSYMLLIQRANVSDREVRDLIELVMAPIIAVR